MTEEERQVYEAGLGRPATPEEIERADRELEVIRERTRIRIALRRISLWLEWLSIISK